MVNKLSEHYTNLDIDLHGGCFYIRLSRAKVTKTVECGDLVHVDLGKKDQLVGVELVRSKWYNFGITCSNTKRSTL